MAVGVMGREAASNNEQGREEMRDARMQKSDSLLCSVYFSTWALKCE